ncbi:MAG: BatA and WFA domain-containing protein [Elusimicrobiota bacterium]
MTFLNSAFLFGLTAVSIPIIIHLLSKKKPRIINFSDLRFLELAARQYVKKFRIRQYLLLLIRCLLIGILTFIFARPVMHYVSSSKNTETVFLIDNSYSMDYYKDGKTRLEDAKNVVRQTLNLLNPQEKITVFSFSDTVIPVVKNPTTDKDLVIKEVERIKIEYKKANITSAINSIKNYFQNNNIERRIIIVTDFAKNSWTQKKDVESQNYKIVCIDVGDNNAKNFAASDLVVDDNKIRFCVSNYSNDKKNISVDLYIDDQIYKSTFLKTYPHKVSEATFDVKNIQKGIHKCFIDIEPDKLLPDNKYFFAFNYKEKPKVLLVDGHPQFSDFNGETFFLKTALTNYSDIKVINFSQFENEETNYSILFFCNVSNFTKNEVLKLKDLMLNNRYLVFFLGDKILDEEYNTKISFLLPCEISSILSNGQLSNYNLFENKEIITDENIHIDKRFLLIPKYNSEVLLKFTDGTPLLIKGKNNVFTFAISANLSYSDIPIRPIFPVIIKQLFSYFLDNNILIKSANIQDTYLKTEETVSEVVLPDYRTVKNSNEILFEKAGVYEIRYKNHKTEYVNINPDTKSGESDLTKIDAIEIKKIFDKMFSGVVIMDDNFENKMKKILYGNEITKYLLLLLLMLFIVETLLANWKKL